MEGLRMRICTICVRAGSTGVPGKNWRELSGLPLYALAVQQAKKSGLFDRVVVSSDAAEVLENAMFYGADYVVVRPPEMASDKAAKVPAIAHAVRTAEGHFNETYDVCVDLDATSPLRIVADIVGAVELLETTSAASVITGAESHRSPYFNLVEEGEGGFVSTSKALPQAVVRRQDAPKTYDMNAAVYVWQRRFLVEEEAVFFPTTRIYVMPPERSLDIDSELDFKVVEFIMSLGEKND
jgi:N-acylneuraminate cytidylyltransferase/CMP-N,N'-diacetyllegionaminic acid synthase